MTTGDLFWISVGAGLGLVLAWALFRLAGIFWMFGVASVIAIYLAVTAPSFTWASVAMAFSVCSATLALWVIE